MEYTHSKEIYIVHLKFKFNRYHACFVFFFTKPGNTAPTVSISLFHLAILITSVYTRHLLLVTSHFPPQISAP